MTPWRVAPNSGFEVDDAHGEVGLIQIDRTQFRVDRAFRFTDPAVTEKMVKRLTDNGHTPEDARKRVDDARTFTPNDENPTDLASVPRYMRWFETAYGLHTLAAILHDNLIVDQSDGGVLQSDTMSDHFFRKMLKAVGVGWLKRWIMWAATALRSRWAAGGKRRASIVLWLLLALSGLVLATTATLTGHPFVLLAALTLPLAASALWGRQYGAGLVASAAAPWILPPAILAGIGYLIYSVLEWVARTLKLNT